MIGEMNIFFSRLFAFVSTVVTWLDPWSEKSQVEIFSTMDSFASSR